MSSFAYSKSKPVWFWLVQVREETAVVGGGQRFSYVPRNANHLLSYADRDKVGVAVRELAAGRVLFGSGATEGSLFMQKGAVLDADIGEEERMLVLYENARRIFGI